MNVERFSDLANSHHRDILVEIVGEIHTVDSLLKEVSLDIENFRPEIQYAFRRMIASRQETESITNAIDHQERKILELDQNPAIQKILELEQELKKSATPQYVYQISREIRHLKSIHAQKISARVSIQRQLLQDRLRLVRTWKSVLSDEIQILDESKKVLIDKIISLADSVADPELKDMAVTRLREITGREISVSMTKLDLAKIPVANIHVLRETLRQQLNDVARIENAITEKREVVKTLNKIIVEMEEKCASASPPPMSLLEQSLMTPQKNWAMEAPPVEELEFPELKPSRMATRDRRGRR